MRLFLTHLPHTMLALAVVALFVRIELGERRMRAALVTSGGDADQAERAARPITARGAVGMIIGALFFTAVLVLIVSALQDDEPSPVVVVDYLISGMAAALWAGWGAPRKLAPGMRERMGKGGRVVVRLAVTLVLAGAILAAGMVLSHGVILPPA